MFAVIDFWAGIGAKVMSWDFWKGAVWREYSGDFSNPSSEVCGGILGVGPSIE